MDLRYRVSSAPRGRDTPESVSRSVHARAAPRDTGRRQQESSSTRCGAKEMQNRALRPPVWSAYPYPLILNRMAQTANRSICPRLWRDVLDVVGQGVGMHRAEIDRRLAGLAVEPAQRVPHPILVVAFRIILARMRAPRFRTGDGAVDGDDGLCDKIVELQRLDEIGIPDQAAVEDGNVGLRLEDFAHTLLTLLHDFAGA